MNSDDEPGDVTIDEMIADLRKGGWGETDLRAIRELDALRAKNQS